MPFDQLLLFITLTLFVSASPGPVMLTCMADAGRYGLKLSLFSMLGASLGNLILMLLSALGLGLLLEQSPWVFQGIKYLGAAYLIYLGVALVVAPPQRAKLQLPLSTSRHLLQKAFLVAATNPKGLVYFGALFPLFIDISQAMPPQFALLTGIFLLMDLIWMLIYAQAGSLVMGWLKTPTHQRWFNWGSGAALIATGLLLSLAKLQ